MSGGIASVCRLCLNTNEVLPIFNEDQSEDVSKKIFDCVAIQVSKDNVLPTVICADCLGSVNTWCLFRQKCHETQTALISMFKKELGENVSKDKSQSKPNGVLKSSQAKISEVVCLSDSEDEGHNEEDDLEANDNDVTVFSPSPPSVISLDDEEDTRMDIDNPSLSEDYQDNEVAKEVNGPSLASNQILEKTQVSEESSTEKTQVSEESSTKENSESPTGENKDATVDVQTEPNETEKLSNDVQTEDSLVGNEGDKKAEDSQVCDEVDKKAEDSHVSDEVDKKAEDSHVGDEGDKKTESANPVGPDIDDIVSDILELNKDHSKRNEGEDVNKGSESENKDDNTETKEAEVEPKEVEEISSTNVTGSPLSPDPCIQDVMSTNESNKTEDNSDVSSSIQNGSISDKTKESLSTIRIESTVSISSDAFDDSEKVPGDSDDSKQKEQRTEEEMEIDTTNKDDPQVSTSEVRVPNVVEEIQIEESNDSESIHAEKDKQAPDSTVETEADEGSKLPLPVSSIKQERIDPGYADIENRVVQIKIEPISGDEHEKGQGEASTEDLNIDDPTIDVRTNRCLICRYKYSTLPNLIRHSKTKLHKDLIEKGVKNENEVEPSPLDEPSILKQALARRKIKRRRGPFFKKKRYVCRICHIVFPSAVSLARHSHAQDAQLPVEYPVEDAPSHSRSAPSRSPSPEESDDMTQQFDDRDYICPMPNCNYSCREGTTLLTHMTSHGINKIKSQVPPKPPSLPLVPKIERKDVKPIIPKIEYRQEYRCEHHDVVFFDKRGYANHVRTCDFAPPLPPKEFKQAKTLFCKICNLKFSSKEVHLNHLRVYHRMSATVEHVPQQPLVPQKASFLVRTNQMKNRRQNAYCCNTCGKKFNFLYSLNYHLKTHQNQVPSVVPSSIACKICKKSFKTYKVYRVHLRSHFLPPGSRKLFCSKCYKTFDNRSEIGLHRSRGQCKSIKMKIFPCSVCNHSFKDLETLNQHKETAHCPPSSSSSVSMGENDSIIKYCKLCNKSFSNYANLRRHCMTLHRMNQLTFLNLISKYPKPEVGEAEEPTIKQEEVLEPEGEMYPCNYCGKSFKLQRILTLHLNNFCVNSPNRPKCGKCGTFITKRGCEGCPSSSESVMVKSEEGYEKSENFIVPVSVLDPMSAPSASSVDPQLFSCPIGRMSFTNEKSMLRHYSYCNGDCAEVINCGNCRKGFKNLKMLELHTCVKSRQSYRYNCIKCLRSFSRKNYLVNHESKCIGYTLDEVPLNTLVANTSNELQADITPNRTDAPTPLPKPGLFRCDLCPKTFSSQKSVCGHQWVHKPKGRQSRVQTYECKFCLKDNIVLNQLYPHNYKCIKTTLMSQEVLSCGDCDAFFSRDDTSKELAAKVQNHVLMCYPVPYFKNQDPSKDSPKLLCCYCGYAFSSVESLTAHKAIHIRNKVINKKRKANPYVKPKKKMRTNASRALGVHFLDNFIEQEVPFEGEASQIEEGEYEDYEETVEDFTDSSIGDQIFPCGVCNRQFPDPEQLAAHEKGHILVRKSVPNEIEITKIV